MMAFGNARGTVLIEALVTGVVLAIAVIGLASLFSFGQSFVVAEGDQRAGIFLAQQKIENLRSLGFACIPVGSGDSVTSTCSGVAAQDYDESGADLGLPRYSRSTTVACVDSITFAPIGCPNPITAKRITVTVNSTLVQAEAITVESVVTLY